MRGVGSISLAGCPAYSTRAGKEPRKYPAVKSSRVSVCPGETPGDAESLLQGQCTKFHLQALTLGSTRRRAEWTRDASGKSEFGGPGERTEGTACQDPSAESCPIQQNPINIQYYATFLRHSTPHQRQQSEKAIAPPSGITFPHDVELKLGC